MRIRKGKDGNEQQTGREEKMMHMGGGRGGILVVILHPKVPQKQSQIWIIVPTKQSTSSQIITSISYEWLPWQPPM